MSLKAVCRLQSVQCNILRNFFFFKENKVTFHKPEFPYQAYSTLNTTNTQWKMSKTEAIIQLIFICKEKVNSLMSLACCKASLKV